MMITNCVINLFTDSTKFREINGDPTPARLTSLQHFNLKTLVKREEINVADFSAVCPKNAKQVIAHGLPKIRK